MSNTETKTTCDCEICKKTIPLEKAIQCEFCNKEDDTACDDTNCDDTACDDTNCDDTACDDTLGLPTKEKEPHLFCKKCTSTCFSCEEIGCDKCVDVVCCDCGVTMCSECRNRDKLCGCYGKCYCCDIDLDRGSSGWPCNECEKWYCHDCGLTYNSCKECGPESDSDDEDEEDDLEQEAIEATESTEAIEPIKTTCVCESCKTNITLETAIPCDLCNREHDVDGWDEDKISPLFCKECALWCDACKEVQGCKECIKNVCWECDYNMCYECRNTDNIMCGCFGECYTCGRDVDRGSDGWPCNECEKWYCHNCRCRLTDNSCKECGPDDEATNEATNESKEAKVDKI